jgi:hypothetical protein
MRFHDAFSDLIRRRDNGTSSLQQVRHKPTIASQEETGSLQVTESAVTSILASNCANERPMGGILL